MNRGRRLLGALGLFMACALSFGAAGARAVLPAPEYVRQTARVFSADGATFDDFGSAVAISGDTAVVGAPDKDDAGAAYVYQRSGTGWVFAQRLVADVAMGDAFGCSVDIDGDWIVVGATGATTSAALDSGAAYLYHRTPAGWTYQTELAPDANSAGDQFGCAVAILGEHVVVGARLDDDNNTDAGAVYLFRNGVFAEKERGFSEAGDHFGSSVDISSEHVWVGAPDRDVGMVTDAGRVVKYGWSGSDWYFGDGVSPDTYEQGSGFGASLSVSGDTLVVGVPHDDTGLGADAGTAHVFERDPGGGSLWFEIQVLSPPQVYEDYRFGYSVAVEGDIAVIGMMGDFGADNGAAYVYSRSEGAWTQRQRIASSGAAGFGCSVALARGTAVTGASADDGAVADSGTAYIFARHDPVYRFYNMRVGTHFYTPNVAERDMVISLWPTIYTYEGIGYWVNPLNNNQSLYRFYNKKNGSHFYTASEAEKASVIANLSATYSYDGPTYKVSTTAAGKPPVYRFYNKRNGSHFYTASEAEKASVIKNLAGTYAYEGAAFWLGQ